MSATMTKERKPKPSLAFAKPLNDYVLIRFEYSAYTEGGLKLPDSASVPRDKYQVGEVVAVGPGQLTLSGDRQTMNVSKGDRVIFNLQSAERVKILERETDDDGVMYVFVGERNLLGVL